MLKSVAFFVFSDGIPSVAVAEFFSGIIQFVS